MIEQASLVIGEGNWAVKSDSLLGYKINNGKYYPREMSVVRATTGTRINEDGLVELVPYNLVQYSEQFDNAFYTKNNSSISANATTAPNGTTTADKLVENSANDYHYINIPANTTPSGMNTLSVYAKADGRDWVWLYLFDSVAGSLFAYFNVANGTLGTVQSGLTANIESVGDGWYRCSITRTQANAGNGGFGLATSDNVVSYTGNGTSGVYIWGAQLVEGSSALDYLPTTDRLDVARIDYSSGSAALLVEPQRTNLNLYSEDLSNAWYNKYNSSISTNVITAPSGISNADKIIENTNNSFHYVETVNSLSFGQSYTISAYLKKAERDFGYIGVYTFESKQIRVNLTNGTIENTTGTWINTKIEDAGNGWYRVSGTFDAYSTSYFFAGSALNATTVSYTGNGTSGIYLWGAQLELGSYATSYIPTQGSTVTRNADVISKTGIADLIGQTEGSVFLDVDYTNRGTNYLIQLTDGTNDFIELYIAGGVLYFSGYNGSSQWDISTALTNGRHKIAYAYKSNDIAFYVDGVLIGTDTSAAIPTCNGLYVNQNYTNQYNQKQYYNAVAIWKTRLTNAQLATLTTI